MSALKKPKLISLDEYLVELESSQVKLIFDDGVVYSMPGGTDAHNVISTRMIEIRARNGKKPCQGINSDQAIYIEQVNKTYFPDALFVCGKRQHHDPKKLLLVNPTVLVEVLSPSNRFGELLIKFNHYSLIPNLQDLIVINQHEPYIEHYKKSANGRLELDKIIEGIDSDLYIESLDSHFPLSELYSDLLD